MDASPDMIPVVTIPNDDGYDIRFWPGEDSWIIGSVYWDASDKAAAGLVLKFGGNCFLPETVEGVQEVLTSRKLRLADLSHVESLVKDNENKAEKEAR